ncbi:MAG: hypothetical protein AAFQ41_07605 [Cyanobacteria bacterium J06623_7]
MELIKDIDRQKGYLTAQVWFGLFDRYIDLLVDDEANFSWDYAHKCAVYLHALTDGLIDRLCIASINYCNTFLEDTGQELIRFSDRHDVLKLITPLSLTIPEMQRDEPVIHLELDCEWEPEHGMEWIVRADRVLFVSAFEGEDPWGDFLESDEYNFAC